MWGDCPGVVIKTQEWCTVWEVIRQNSVWMQFCQAYASAALSEETVFQLYGKVKKN